MLDKRRTVGYNGDIEADEVVRDLISVLELETGDFTMAGKTRRANIDKVAFIKAYVAASKNGGTNADVGKQFGLDAQQTSLKASQLRRELEEKGKSLPYLEKANRKVANSEEFDAVLDMLDDVPETEATE